RACSPRPSSSVRSPPTGAGRPTRCWGIGPWRPRRCCWPGRWPPAAGAARLGTAPGPRLRRMMNGDGQGEARGKEPVERVIDLFVHMPIGFAGITWIRVPAIVGTQPELVGDAVSKGCGHLAEADVRLAEESRTPR